MTLDEAVNRFGTGYMLCKALRLTPQNYTRWKKINYLPYHLQYKIAELTNGELMPDDIDPKSLLPHKGWKHARKA